MRKIFSIVFCLAYVFSYSQGYQPNKHIVINDAIFPAQNVPFNGRLMYYDTSLFKYRDFKDTQEVRLNRPTSQSRFGHEFISVHQGGTLNSDGSFTGGITTLWWYRNGVADNNLVKIYVDSVNITREVDTMYRKTDSTIGFTIGHGPEQIILIRGTAAGGISSLILTTPITLFASPVTFSNSGGAWSGTLTLANQNPNVVFAGPSSGSPGAPTFRSLTTADLPTSIPNANLQNSSINFGIGSSGTSPGWAASSTSLGSTATLNLPTVNSVNTGIVNPILYNFWSAKVDSTVQSNDSVYEWRNGTRFFRYIIVGGSGGISSLNGLTGATQTFATGTVGSDFGISSSGATHTFNLPTADATHTGKLSNTDWSTFNNKVSSVSNSDGSLTISPTTGAVVVSLNTAHSNTFSVGQNFNGSSSAFNGGLVLGSTFSFAADNTYAIGSPTVGAQNVWTREVASPAQLSLASTTGNSVGIYIGSNPGITLLSTGQAQLNNYTTSSSFTGTPLAFLQTDASGNIIQIPTGSIQLSLANEGAGYRLFDPTNNKIKSLMCTGCTLDSLTTGQIGITVTGGGSGTVTSVAASVPSSLLTIGGSPITTNGTLAFGLANFSAHTYFGNNTGSSATPIQVTSTQLTADLNLFTTTLQGLVPAPGSVSGKVLSDNGGWISLDSHLTGTMTANTSVTVSSTAAIYMIVVNPVSQLNSFQVGITSSGQEVVANRAVPVGANTVFIPNYYMGGNTTLYFQGITSNTTYTIIPL